MNKPLAWVGEKFGVKSLLGAIVVVYALVPNQLSYFSFWKNAAISIVHSPWFVTWFLPGLPRLCVVIVGVVIILWDYRGRITKITYNLRITRISSTQLLYNQQHGHFIRNFDPLLSQYAYLMEVINEAKPKKSVRNAGKVRAQLSFRIGDSVQVASPGVWVGEFFSSVDFGPGETRELILALRKDLGYWAIGFNRRGSSGEAVSTTFDQIIPKYTPGTLSVELVSSESGRIIARAEVEWEWPANAQDIPRFTGHRQLS